tara:strand:- start:567 stop:851 length:285 start_codon:yes stop_codon:yes gene_type:complete
MKPYRTQGEALGILTGKIELRDYDDVLGGIPHEGVRRLVDLRLDGRYKRLRHRNDMELVRHIDWVNTPEGGRVWANITGWMAGLNDLPELANAD